MSYAFNTASNFVPAGYDVTTARIDDDGVDDVVLHSPSGSYAFYHMGQSGNGLEPITNVLVGQLDTQHGNALVYWARMMPNLNEPGGSTRDDALVYVPSSNQFGTVRCTLGWRPVYLLVDLQPTSTGERRGLADGIFRDAPSSHLDQFADC